MLGHPSLKSLVVSLAAASLILVTAAAPIQSPSSSAQGLAQPELQAGDAGNAAPDATLQYGADIAPIASLQIPGTMESIKQLGFTYAQYYLDWRAVEPYRDMIRWNVIDPVVKSATNRGIKLVFRIYRAPAWVPRTGGMPADAIELGRFVQALVRRYNPQGGSQRVAAYVIWSEPNTKAGWEGQPLDPAAYVAMLRQAHKAAKLTNPAVTIVSANLAPTSGGIGAINDLEYLDGMYAAGLNDVADVVGMSGIGFHDAPDDTSHILGYNFSRLAQLHDVMTRHRANKPAWALEVGWAAETGYSVGAEFEWWQVSKETQALYLRRAMQKASQQWPWLTAMFIWNLNFYYQPSEVPHEPEKGAFAILSRPAYNCIKLANPVCPHPVYVPLALRR